MIFIDNSNVYKHLAGLCQVEGNIWCKRYDPHYLATRLVGKRELVRVMFYCAPPPQALFQRNPAAYAAQNSYYDHLKNLPKLEVKYATLTTNDGQLYEKNLDTQLTADVISMAATNQYDQAIIISNDGDFVSAVEGAKTLGKKIEIAHFKERFSMDLRKAADVTRRLRPSHFKRISS